MDEARWGCETISIKKRQIIPLAFIWTLASSCQQSEERQGELTNISGIHLAAVFRNVWGKKENTKQRHDLSVEVLISKFQLLSRFISKCRDSKCLLRNSQKKTCDNHSVLEMIFLIIHMHVYKSI